MLRRLFVLWLAFAPVLFAACDKPPTSPSQNCTFAVSDGPAGEVAGTGLEFTVSVTTGAGCNWAASSGAAFIVPVGSTTGTGDGTVRFSIQSNSSIARQGTVQVATRTILVNQAAGCQFNVTPTEANVAKSGADVAVDVTVTSGSNCTWTTTSGSAYVTVKEGANGAGNGRAVLTVAPNAGEARVGTATVAGRAVAMLQESAFPPPVPCAFVVTPSRFDVLAAGLSGGVVTITKTAGGTCPWIATPVGSFIALRNNSGEGTGTVTFDVAPNTGASRGGEILFNNSLTGPHTTIAQAAFAGSYQVATLSYVSDPGDYIGGGGSDSVTGIGTTAEVVLSGGQSTLALNIPTGGHYSLSLRSANGEPLAPGTYNRVARYPFQPAGTPGLSFTGNSRGCNQVTGRFLIAAAQFSGTQVQRFHARFEQHCEGWSAPLRGVVWIDANGASPPAIADFPPAPSTPVTTFSYVSDPGDPVGRGNSATLTLAGINAIAWAREFDSSVDIRLQSAPGTPSQFWQISFEGPSGARLQPGTYNNATRYPFNPSGVPGLSVAGNGAGCGTVTGSFVVTQAEYGPQGEVLRFHATFEQRCDGLVAALRGEIRIVADPWK